MKRKLYSMEHTRTSLASSILEKGSEPGWLLIYDTKEKWTLAFLSESELNLLQQGEYNAYFKHGVIQNINTDRLGYYQHNTESEAK